MNLAIRNHVSNKKTQFETLENIGFLNQFREYGLPPKENVVAKHGKMCEKWQFLPPKHSFLSVNT